jgi:hypothetical protein
MCAVRRGLLAPKSNHGGWYAGVGAEYAVLDYMILGIDYKPYQFDSKQRNCNLAVVSCSALRLPQCGPGRGVCNGPVRFKFNPRPTAQVSPGTARKYHRIDRVERKILSLSHFVENRVGPG